MQDSLNVRDIVAMKPNDTCSAPYLVPGIGETIMIMAIDDIDSPGIFRRKESNIKPYLRKSIRTH